MPVVGGTYFDHILKTLRMGIFYKMDASLIGPKLARPFGRYFAEALRVKASECVDLKTAEAYQHAARYLDSIC